MRYGWYLVDIKLFFSHKIECKAHVLRFNLIKYIDFPLCYCIVRLNE